MTTLTEMRVEPRQWIRESDAGATRRRLDVVAQYRASAQAETRRGRPPPLTAEAYVVRLQAALAVAVAVRLAVGEQPLARVLAWAWWLLSTVVGW